MTLIPSCLLNRSARIVGSKGATIQRLRAESGADIIVGNNGSDLIEIVGGASGVRLFSPPQFADAIGPPFRSTDKDSVLHAKDAVIEIASWPDRR